MESPYAFRMECVYVCEVQGIHRERVTSGRREIAWTTERITRRDFTLASALMAAVRFEVGADGGWFSFM